MSREIKTNIKGSEVVINTKNHREQCMELVRTAVRVSTPGLRKLIEGENVIQIRIDDEYLSFIVIEYVTRQTPGLAAFTYPRLTDE